MLSNENISANNPTLPTQNVKTLKKKIQHANRGQFI